MKNPFHNLSNPVSFGLPANTVNFYISGSAGKLGAWYVTIALSEHISIFALVQILNLLLRLFSYLNIDK